MTRIRYFLSPSPLSPIHPVSLSLSLSLHRTPFATFAPDISEGLRVSSSACSSARTSLVGIAGKILRRCDNERSDRYLRAARVGVLSDPSRAATRVRTRERARRHGRARSYAYTRPGVTS